MAMRMYSIRTLVWVCILWVLLLISCLLAQQAWIFASHGHSIWLNRLKGSMETLMSDRVIYDSKMDAASQLKRMEKLDYILDKTVLAYVKSSDDYMTVGDKWVKAMDVAEYLSFRQKHPRIYVYNPHIHDPSAESVDAEVRAYIEMVRKIVNEKERALLSDVEMGFPR